MTLETEKTQPVSEAGTVSLSICVRPAKSQVFVPVMQMGDTRLKGWAAGGAGTLSGQGEGGESEGEGGRREGCIRRTKYGCDDGGQMN